MDLMGLKNRTKNRRINLEQRLSDRFERLNIRGNLCFRKSTDGVIFSLCSFPVDEAIVVEYAENLEEAMLNRFEDGDLFYLEDMDEDTMFQNILREIEG